MNLYIEIEHFFVFTSITFFKSDFQTVCYTKSKKLGDAKKGLQVWN